MLSDDEANFVLNDYWKGEMWREESFPNPDHWAIPHNRNNIYITLLKYISKTKDIWTFKNHSTTNCEAGTVIFARWNCVGHHRLTGAFGSEGHFEKIGILVTSNAEQEHKFSNQHSSNADKHIRIRWEWMTLPAHIVVIHCYGLKVCQCEFEVSGAILYCTVPHTTASNVQSIHQAAD